MVSRIGDLSPQKQLYLIVQVPFLKNCFDSNRRGMSSGNQVFTKCTGIEKTERMTFENHEVAETVRHYSNPLLGLSRMTPQSQSHRCAHLSLTSLGARMSSSLRSTASNSQISVLQSQGPDWRLLTNSIWVPTRHSSNGVITVPRTRSRGCSLSCA